MTDLGAIKLGIEALKAIQRERTMTIDDAIYELNSPDDLTFNRHTVEFGAALQLGIEALKAWRQAKMEGKLSPKELLPGETEE